MYAPMARGHILPAARNPFVSPGTVIQSRRPSQVPLTVQTAVGQSANVIEYKTSAAVKNFQLTPLGSAQFGATSGNDYMSIGPVDSSVNIASRGIACGSSYQLYSAASLVANISSVSVSFNVPLTFSASNTINATGFDAVLTLNGFSGASQARAGNGVSVLAGPGGTGGAGNFAGGNIIISPGASSGNTTPATIAFKGSVAGSSGGGVQTLSTVIEITNSTSITFSDAVNIVVNATTGTKIATATTQKLGFWNSTPVVQPSATGVTTAGYTQNASANAVVAESTFTGNTGSTAYTISDIIKNLKVAGILAA